MLRRRALLVACPLLVAASSALHCLTPAAVAAQPATANAPASTAAARAASPKPNAAAAEAAAAADADPLFLASAPPAAAAAAVSGSSSVGGGSGLVPRPLPLQLPAPVPVSTGPVAKRSDTGGFKHMFAGALAGMASKTILQPLDLVKVRLQVQDGTGKNEYKGLRDGVLSILRNDGFLGLYRGLAPNLMASGVSWGVYFFSYNHAKNFWRTHLLRAPPAGTPVLLDAQGEVKPARLGPFAHLSCAAFSGTLATLCTNPFSMVKTRLQLQGKEVNSNARLYSGVFDAFQRIVREEGFVTLYRGIGPSLVLVSNGALQFMSYEELKRLTITHLIASHEERELHAAHFLCMGALAKVFSASVTYPMAVTRARLYQRKPDELLKQIAAEPIVPTVVSSSGSTLASSVPHGALGPAAPALSLSHLASKHVDSKYHGMLDVISKIWALEGWRGFYRGLTPMLIKTAPSSAITFLIYESTIKLLHAEPQPKKASKYE